MKVLWTAPAANQLSEIFEYISADNPAAAARMVRRIRNSVHQTAKMPNAGRMGRVVGTREIVVANYLVAYRVHEGAIQVLAVLHGAQQWPESF